MPEPKILRRHEQIADYYAGLMQEGRILPGYKLPSVEEIRGTWLVGRETAHNAIRELQRRDLVVIKPKHGTFAKAS